MAPVGVGGVAADSELAGFDFAILKESQWKAGQRGAGGGVFRQGVCKSESLIIYLCRPLLRPPRFKQMHEFKIFFFLDP